jgi:hypothetical protein
MIGAAMDPRHWLGLALVGLAVGCGSRTGLGGGPGAGGDDGGLPPLDAAPAPDVFQSDCPTPDSTFIYVVTQQGELFSFYPPTALFTDIGALNCPARGGSPFSMAVNRQGVAFVLFDDGELFELRTKNAVCSATSYVPGQGGVSQFGMGFATDQGGPAETLFVAESATGTLAGLALGTIDDAFMLHEVAPFTNPMRGPELTGTGDGRLYAFYSPLSSGEPGSRVAQLDKATARIIAEDRLPGVDQGEGWAFGFWGGNFWLFTSPLMNGESDVTRFNPTDGSVTKVTTLPQLIVGAGVSTCAPR